LEELKKTTFNHNKCSRILGRDLVTEPHECNARMLFFRQPHLLVIFIYYIVK